MAARSPLGRFSARRSEQFIAALVEKQPLATLATAHKWRFKKPRAPILMRGFRKII
jgi:hypothetical protein